MSTAGGKTEVVVVGSSNTDMVVASEKLPRPGETVLGGSFYRAPGGKGANQAVAAARAGARVAFIGCVGDDDLGRETRHNLQREGIDLEGLTTVEGEASGVALILVDGTGGNLISVAPGANARLTPARVEASRKVLQEAKVLLLQLEVPLPAAERAVSLAADAGVTVLFNPAPAPGTPLEPGFLERVSVLVANEEEMNTLSGSAGPEEGAARMLASGVRHVIVTLGDKGGRIYTGNSLPRPYPGEAVEAVDTVAAGDCFCGWLAASLAEGEPLETGVRLAARAAALSATRRGAQPSLPWRNEVR